MRFLECYISLRHSRELRSLNMSLKRAEMNDKKKSSESDVVELGRKINEGKQKKLLIMRATNRRIPSVSSFKSKVMIPEDKFYILQSLTYNTKSNLRNGTEHGREVKGKRSARHSKSPTNYQQNASFTENAQKQSTCSSCVYAFQRGLVSSEEAKTFDSFKPKHVLPAVIAERIGSVDQKKYRLVNVRQFFVFYDDSTSMDRKKLTFFLKTKTVFYRDSLS